MYISTSLFESHVYQDAFIPSGLSTRRCAAPADGRGALLGQQLPQIAQGCVRAAGSLPSHIIMRLKSFLRDSSNRSSVTGLHILGLQV